VSGGDIIATGDLENFHVESEMKADLALGTPYRSHVTT